MVVRVVERMRIGHLIGVIAALVLAGAARADERLAPDELTDEHIAAALTALSDELQARRKPRTFWEPKPWDSSGEDGSETQRGGYTALAVLAQLHAGISYQDHRLEDAIAWLETASLRGTYAVSTRAAVWAMLPPKFEPHLKRDVDWLLTGFSTAARGWTYEQKPNTTVQDHSIRQFGALAWWEAARRDVGIDDRYWHALEASYVESQLDDGGWNYKADLAPPRGSMTCAGLATLFITQDLLHGPGAVKLRRTSEPTPADRAIVRGLAWMDANFLADDNPGSLRDYFYYVWCVERVGLASGRRSFGGQDWFRTCAAEVIHRLCAWDADANTMTVRERWRGRANGRSVSVRHLSFAILFLSRGRVPIAVSKLEVPGARWNNRPRDVANLAHHLSSTAETEFNWQLVSIEEPVERWLAAPMLVAATDDAAVLFGTEVPKAPRRRRGDDAPPVVLPPSPEIIQGQLKSYLDRGGLLVMWNDGRSRRDVRETEAIGTALYPHLEWTDAPDDHPAYTLHTAVDGKRAPLRVLNNGVRDLMIVAPRSDFGAAFQVRDRAKQGDLYTIASNLFFAASEMGALKPRLAAHPAAPPADRTAAASRTLRIARAVPHDAHLPEPAALPAFVRWARLECATEVELIDCALADIATLDPPVDLVVVSGTAAHTFTPPEEVAVESFIARPRGTVLFETAGGRGAFTSSAETVAAKLFARPLRPVTGTALATGDAIHGGFDLRHVGWRAYSVEVFGARETVLRVQSMQFDGAPRVLFSREDLSHALLDQPRHGICGYRTESARRILANVLFAAADQTSSESE